MFVSLIRELKKIGNISARIDILQQKQFEKYA